MLPASSYGIVQKACALAQCDTPVFSTVSTHTVCYSFCGGVGLINGDLQSHVGLLWSHGIRTFCPRLCG